MLQYDYGDSVWEGEGVLSYSQDILGGFCPRQQKRVGGGGILSGERFCPTLNFLILLKALIVGTG